MTSYSIKKLAATLTLIACSLGSVWAQTSPKANLAEGEIRKVDKEAGKITIRHGDIKSIDMPPMTMVFVVKDKALLDKFQAGDKVKFDVVRDGGKLVITEMEPR